MSEKILEKSLEMEVFLRDMSLNSTYEFIEYGSDLRIQEIAQKRGIQLPSQDLAIFKCVYAFIERQNLNGCTLPKEEVEKSLGTLVGKAVDFDHLRKRVVGYWIDAYLEGDKIIAYGIFHKSNFDEDYKLIKELMEKGVLCISFEAWGNRIYNADKTYTLKNIEFAGGALLIKTSPAFPGSEVMEFSNKERVLELAKVFTEPDKFIYEGQEEYFIFELEGEDGKKLSYKEREALSDDMFAIVKTVNDKKIRMYPIQDENHVRAALSRLGQEGPKATLKRMGISIEEVKRKVLKRAKELNMKSLLENYSGGNLMEEKIKTLESEVASLSEQLKVKTEEVASVSKIVTEKDTMIVQKDEEIAKIKATLDELKKESEEAKLKIEQIEKSKSEEIAKAREEAIKITQRKAELGETQLTDAEILDDVKFENAKLKKAVADKDTEIATLKEEAKKKKKVDEDKDGEGKDKEEAKKDLDKGSKKDEDTTKKAGAVRSLAFPEK